MRQEGKKREKERIREEKRIIYFFIKIERWRQIKGSNLI
jgi:hypothetical protein